MYPYTPNGTDLQVLKLFPSEIILDIPYSLLSTPPFAFARIMLIPVAAKLKFTLTSIKIGHNFKN